MLAKGLNEIKNRLTREKPAKLSIHAHNFSLIQIASKKKMIAIPIYAQALYDGMVEYIKDPMYRLYIDIVLE